MKNTQNTTLFCLLLNSIFCFSQNPIFTKNLESNQNFICFGGSVKFKTTVLNANFYKFQLKSGDIWNDFAPASGTISLSSTDLEYTFSNINSDIFVRVLISNGNITSMSNEVGMSAQKPLINFHPIDLIGCNGSSVNFKTNASGVGNLTFQWFKANTASSSYVAISNSFKFSGTTSNSLIINSLTNSEHLSYYKCIIKDINNCESYTNNAKLSVNQLSTSVSPTVTTKFCEGDSAVFTVALQVGEIIDYQWQMRKSPATTYSDLMESSKFLGVKTSKLIVARILTTENAYKLKVNFKETTQGVGGTLVNGTCSKEAFRTSYIINPRPTSPLQIPDVSRCGPGKITTSIVQAGNFYWYQDTLLAPILNNSSTFSSPILNENKAFFYSLKDLNGCESLKKTFLAKVIPRPKARFPDDLSLCPAETTLSVALEEVQNSANRFYLLKGTNNLSNFNEILNNSITLPLIIPFPLSKTSGVYDFRFFTKNEENGCFSDTSFVKVRVKVKTEILNEATNTSICEGSNHNFISNFKGEKPISFKWIKDNFLIENEVDSTLKLDILKLENSGNYQIEIKASCGTVISKSLNLIVKPKTKIITHPKNIIVCEKSEASFSVVATGSGILQYQWYINNIVIGNNGPNLTIPNTNLGMDFSSIKCKITSDCDPPVLSDVAILRIDDIPMPPIVSSQVGFCQNTLAIPLTVGLLNLHTEKWFNKDQNRISRPIIETNLVDTTFYYVSQIDSNSCESLKSRIEVIISPKFTLEVLSNVIGLCKTGTLNKEGNIYTRINNQIPEEGIFNFKLFLNNSKIRENTVGEFLVSESGKYVIESIRNYCKVSSPIAIENILPELISNINSPDQSICFGKSITQIAVSDLTGGDYYWWMDDSGSGILKKGPTYEILNVTSPQNFFVSYVKSKDGVFCETQRKEIKISLKPALKTNFEITNQSCANITDGRVLVSILNGLGPFVYQLNTTISNSTGFFTSLSAGNYSIKVEDAEGCKLDSTIKIELKAGAIINLQPISIKRCKGNIANFIITAENYSEIIWQIKKPNDTKFVDIPNTNTVTLRLENIGNEINPHNSIYRAKVINANCEILSREATLGVNSISGSMSPRTVCQNSDIVLDLTGIQINGNVGAYQWQFRPGTSGSWIDLSGKTATSLIINRAIIADAGFYRSKVTFDNGSVNTCIINTSTSGLALSLELPQISTLSPNQTICKGQSTILSALNCSGTFVWSNGHTGSSISVSPLLSTNFTVICKTPFCETPASSNILVTVIDGQIVAPSLISNQKEFCIGETIKLKATGCNGDIKWSNGASGIDLQIVAQTNFGISAHCVNSICKSNESEMLQIKVALPLSPGSIQNNSIIQCSGFNPATISSIVNPSGGKKVIIKWQFSENCNAESPIWQDIPNSNNSTLNPEALFKSTCFRRQVSDSCNAISNSNSSQFTIIQDPVIQINTQNSSICLNDSAKISSAIIGGILPCQIYWQKNEASASPSSSDWTDLKYGNTKLNFKNPGFQIQKTIHFRAKYVCDLASCNQAFSNVVSILFYPINTFEVAFVDSTICLGNAISLKSANCTGQYVWSTGQATPEISVAPISNTNYWVKCFSACETIQKNISISVHPSNSLPQNTTPASVYSPNSIQFSALGQNLKWYTSAISIAVLTTAPLVNAVAEHSFWVSQTIGPCESQRLKITSTIFQSLEITTQPKNQTNCDGNLANFVVSAIGNGSITYQWQIKLPNISNFRDINSSDVNNEDFLSPILKVKNIGNAQNPHLTVFRCKISANGIDKFSQEATLGVNSISGSLVNQIKCIGDNFELNLLNTHQLKGTISKIQWQSRHGTSQDWSNMIDDADIFGTSTLFLSIRNLKISNKKQYRAQITFTSNSGLCIETTDNMNLYIGEFPPNPTEKSFEFCQNEVSPKLNIFVPKEYEIVWFTQKIGGTRFNSQPKVDMTKTGDTGLFFAFENKFKCMSERIWVYIKIRPEPPLPINTTPTIAETDNGLKFTAYGENLKWYTSRTGSTYLTSEPYHEKAGKYDYFVSQTNEFGCESDKKAIVAELIESFGIETSPKNQTDCLGNSVLFSIKTKGKTIPTYLWQKKLVTDIDFKNLNNENKKDLKIDEIGSLEYPNGSTFRCIVSDGQKNITSNIATLSVNNFNRNIGDLDFCDNTFLPLIHFSKDLEGEVSQVEWQQKNGAQYPTIYKSDQLSSPANIISGTYRLRFTFKNGSSGTCVRSSNDFKIKVLETPKISEKTFLEVCQYEKTKKIFEMLPGKSIWFQKNEIITEIDTKISKNTLFEIKLVGSNGCISNFQTIDLKVKPSPYLNITDTSFNFCRFSDPHINLDLQNKATYWFKSLDDKDPTLSFFQIDNSKDAITTKYAAIMDSTGCLSNTVPVTIKVETCFMGEPTDSCLLVSNILKQDWNYFFDKNGKVFAAIEPQNENLGEVNLSIQYSKKMFLEDNNQNKFFPRYYFFTAQKNIVKNVKIRLYFSNFEIENYHKTLKNISLNGKNAIINYTGKNQDCKLENNEINDIFWIIDQCIWQKTDDPDFLFVEFETNKFGEFGIWNNLIPDSKLEGQANLNYKNKLEIRQDKNVKDGKYVILKSENKKSWFILKELIANENEILFFDNKPFKSQSHYQLIYDFGNSIKMNLNELTLETNQENGGCFAFDNPTENRDIIRLSFSDLDKSSIKIFDIYGKAIFIKQIIEKEDFFEITPKFSLPVGIIQIVGKNKIGDDCYYRIILK